MISKVKIQQGERGPWRIETFRITKQQERRTALAAAINGRGYVPDGKYTKLTRDGQTIMSDTPDEMSDHVEAVQRAKGHCLINGLGLGMILAAVLNRPAVESVTVVEASLDVIDLVAWQYRDPRIRIVYRSAYEFHPPSDVHYGMVWHDIWDTISPDNLPEMRRLRHKFKGRCDWQGCWARRDCVMGKREMHDIGRALKQLLCLPAARELFGSLEGLKA